MFSLQIFNLDAKDMNFGSYVPLADRKMLAMFEVLSDRLDQVEQGVSILSKATHSNIDIDYIVPIE